MNRRDLLKRTGAAIIPAAFLGSRLSAAGISRQIGTPRIAAVVYDERYSDCRSFADILVRHGATPFAVNSDCGRLWHGALRENPVWRAGSVAGLTTDSDFLVSRACGREVGLGVSYEGAHDSRELNCVKHRFQSCAYPHEIAAPLSNEDASWAESLAQSLVRARWRNGTAIFRAPVWVETSRSHDHPGYLTSWLLEKST